MCIVLIGQAAFGAETLRALLAVGHEVAGTFFDESVGRYLHHNQANTDRQSISTCPYNETSYLIFHIEKGRLACIISVCIFG
jgi:hypothetical protein